MKLVKVRSEGLAHNSYYLSSRGEAAVIDPRRDSQIYSQLAAEDCSKIRYILETHRNEDYIVGSLELQNQTGAQICHSKMLPFRYGEQNLSGGDTLNLGDVKIKALYTPGHTDESLCYLVYEGEEAKLVFSGDTLFAGSVGRTDLYGANKWATQAQKLYDSLQGELLTLDSGVLVYPAHGAGSVCGGGITGYEPTSIGYEKQTNPYLRLTKEGFVERAMAEQLVKPRYFKTMEEQNLNGAPLLSELSYPKPLTLSQFEEQMQHPGMVVLDTRRPYSYAGAHVPNALSLWLNGSSAYTGWLLDPAQQVIFIHERASDNDTATTWLRRQGFDNLGGFLCGGMEEWQEAGNPIKSNPTITASLLRGKLDRGEVALLDVREPHEWLKDGYVGGATLINFAELPQKTAELPMDKPWAVTCSVGNRSSIAVSILERAGISGANVLGGMTAWTNLGYPTKKGF
ncbi:MAG: rhodanese-like domain-containing protein [Candidatus Bathyarchaeota archaeon]|nr:rhodanese-like domain-containing protein [Candidatus Bathyarchaeota archaeon]